MNSQTAFGIALLAIASVLTGCGGGGGDGASPASATAPANTSTSAPVASNPTPAPAAPAPGATNRSPTISGTAVAAINAGNSYNFLPNAADPDGDALAFSIQNKPTWASFNTATGALTGTPGVGDVGTYANIAISVSDGKATSALGTFTVAVTAVSGGSATLSWMAPTVNTNGTSLTDLAGYRIRYGTSPGALTQTISINTSGITTYVVENLSPATWYFAVSAVSASGAESSNSNTVSKQI